MEILDVDDYVMVSETSKKSFQREVMDYLEKGYSLYGSPMNSYKDKWNTNFCQALVKLPPNQKIKTKVKD